MNYYMEVLKKYTVFGGRARRAEFWMYTLISAIISAVLSLIDLALGLTNVLSSIYGLAVLIPGIAVATRRLHDTNRSGWWQLIAFTIIGIIPLLIWFIQDSDPGDNRFGPNPKAGEMMATA